MSEISDVKAVEWVGGRVRIIDQTKLPDEELYPEYIDYRDVASAIRELKVRGAPAIGIAAAYGLALGAQDIEAGSKREFLDKLRLISEELASTRPTAVNLFWALRRMNAVAEAGDSVDRIKAAMVEEARNIDAEDEAAERRMSG
jgi:methylthioribose-1-phosphate isomerase